MKTRDDQIEFIRRNGVRLASCAGSGFEKQGRGLVCVLSDLENELQRTVPFDFMPATDAAKLFKPWVGSREKGMVEIYDPKIEVVICFMRKGDEDKTDIDCYKIRTTPSPPLAAEQE